MSYLQWYKGSWRFRQRVPQHLRPVIGKREWLHALKTKDEGEAKLRALPYIKKYEEIIRLAEAGEWPPLADEAIEHIARQWWVWVNELPGRFDPLGDPRGAALSNEAELVDLLSKFIVATGVPVKLGGVNFSRLKEAAIAEHHYDTSGYAPDIERWSRMRWQVQAAMDRGDLNGVVSAIGASPVQTESKPVPVKKVIEAWAAEKMPQQKTIDMWASIIRLMTDYLGYDDLARVTTKELIAWKDAMVADPRVAPGTIENRIIVAKTIFNYASKNHHIATNPAKDVAYKKPDDPTKDKRAPTAEEAKRILEAARQEKDPVLRWAPWLAAFGGHRIDEVCGAMVAHVRQEEGVWCLAITPEGREKNGRLKNRGSARIVPLHRAILEEGFLGYVKTLPPEGALFADLPFDKYGKRGAKGSDRVQKWVRRKLGLTDPRLQPSHCWRHWFKSTAAGIGMRKDIEDYFTGHAKRDAADIYRHYGIKQLAKVMNRIKSPAEPIDKGRT